MDKAYSMLGLGKKAGYITSGETGCIQDIKRKKTSLLILAKDSSDNTKNKFLRLCEKKGVKCVVFGQKELLANSIGKELTAIISIKDKKFAKAFLDVLS